MNDDTKSSRNKRDKSTSAKHKCSAGHASFDVPATKSKRWYQKLSINEDDSDSISTQRNNSETINVE